MKNILDKKTKIIATIGPSTESQKQLETLIENGVDVIRLNFSHNTNEWHQRTHDNARKASKRIKKRIAILQDLSGPKIRIGKIQENGVTLKKGEKLILTTKNIIGNEKVISINYKNLPLEIKAGSVIKIEDGKKTLLVEKTTKTEIYTEVIDGGFLSSHKGVNVPGTKLSISSLTAKDKKDVLFGIKNNVDFIAFSFVQTKNDVIQLRKILNKHKSNAKIIVKIETAPAIENFDEILKETDAVMIARGDLAIEIGAEKVPYIQKEIIKKCNALGKPVITATQMLDSMEHSPVPTRAEVSDIANAILDGTDAIMLSGETTIGEYPVEAVKTMVSIAKRTEPNHEDNNLEYSNETINPVDSITRSVVQIANNINARLIVSLTMSGFTARMVERFDPHQGTIAVTPYQYVANQLLLTSGCIPIVMNTKNKEDFTLKELKKLIKKNNWAKVGDKIVVTMGFPFGEKINTNKILIIEAE